EWMHCRAWLVLAGMAVPFAILLRLAAAYLSHTSSIYVWMFADNWDPALLDIAGYRHELGRAATSIIGVAAGTGIRIVVRGLRSVSGFSRNPGGQRRGIRTLADS